jgi:hypothetical protein
MADKPKKEGLKKAGLLAINQVFRHEKTLWTILCKFTLYSKSFNHNM